MNNQNEVLHEYLSVADRAMLVINGIMFGASIVLAAMFGGWLAAIVVGGGTMLALAAIYSLSSGTLVSRIAMALGLMVMSALHIHLAKGVLESHFGIFVLLAALLFYRDWRPIVAAAGLIAVHHLSFYYLQSSGSGVWVIPSTDNGVGIIFVHALYVVVETALLCWFALKLQKEAVESAQIMGATNRIVGGEYIDLSIRTQGGSDLLNQFDAYTQDVETLVSQVKCHAQSILDEGTGLAGVTQEMKSSAQQQQQETDMIAAAVEEMSSAIHEVSKSAELAANSSNEIDESANEAKAVSDDTQGAVKQLTEQVGSAAQTIESLNDQANKIGSVLDVIRGIAEQTNLLALNAAIEAARAGEQGRGFAVVADEVRTLAQRTQQSTAEIDDMITTLQEGSKAAVGAITSSRSQVEGCVSNTESAQKLMEGVSGAIKEISQTNTMVATASLEQSQVIGEVSKNVNNILDASNRNAADADKADQSASNLMHISEELVALSGRFRVQ